MQLDIRNKSLNSGICMHLAGSPKSEANSNAVSKDLRAAMTDVSSEKIANQRHAQYAAAHGHHLGKPKALSCADRCALSSMQGMLQ